jgi:hypothetical protein
VTAAQFGCVARTQTFDQPPSRQRGAGAFCVQWWVPRSPFVGWIGWASTAFPALIANSDVRDRACEDVLGNILPMEILRAPQSFVSYGFRTSQLTSVLIEDDGVPIAAVKVEPRHQIDPSGIL